MDQKRLSFSLPDGLFLLFFIELITTKYVFKISLYSHGFFIVHRFKKKSNKQLSIFCKCATSIILYLCKRITK
ncbi:hypothetical protein EZS27_012503 [termite gut metagenome]|uniref:Uncharacterized protein n=1 Tax=termite gut metagenome TaxID=433724 RepID=A0A5J4S255_9ZZZZ